MLTVEEIKRSALEITDEITVENQYEVARQIHQPVSYPLSRDFTSDQESQMVALPEAAVSRDAWNNAQDSMLDRLVSNVAIWQRNQAIRDNI